MGVMSCHRKNCDNIMCNTYVYSVGYICGSCQTEFKEYIEKNNINVITELQITKELKIFMDTSKDVYSDGNKIDINEFFRLRNIE